MKRVFTCLLAFCLLLSFAGCSADPSGGEFISFYYPRAEITYGSSDGVIGSENRQPTEQAAAEEILQQYLAGPESESFLSPFPEGCKIVTIAMEESGIILTLTDEFAELTGMELSVACSCLALTASALTGLDSVTIRTESALLDGRTEVTLICSALNLTDHYIAPEET